MTIFHEYLMHFSSLPSRPGSLIVILVLMFKQPVTEEYPISVLKKAAGSGNLGVFQVNSSSIKATEEHGFKSAPATSQPTPGDSTVCPLSILTSLVAHYNIAVPRR